ncbi:MAG TPA: hypothetical protein VM434_17655 [Beijerinckiaceae bacterium]|nr:hypothetical protein [Beijerinckiaceae bacterium]
MTRPASDFRKARPPRRRKSKAADASVRTEPEAAAPQTPEEIPHGDPVTSGAPAEATAQEPAATDRPRGEDADAAVVAAPRGLRDDAAAPGAAPAAATSEVPATSTAGATSEPVAASEPAAPIAGAGEHSGIGSPAIAPLQRPEAGPRAAGGSEDAVSRPAHAEPRRRTGFGALAATALIGALLGAGLAILYDLYGRDRLGPGRTPAQAVQDPAAPLAQRLDAIEAAQRGLADRVAAAQTLAERAAGTADAAAKRAEEVAARPAAAPAPPVAAQTAPAAPAVDPAALAQLDERIGALRGELQEQVKALAASLQAIEPRVEANRQALERVAAQAEQQARLAPQVEKAAQQLAALNQQAEARDKQVSALEQQAGAREQRLAGLGQQVAAAEERLAALGKQAAEPRPEAIAALRAVAANRVGQALATGTPYPEAFAALKSLGAEEARLAALEPFAATGAPNAAALAREFAPLGEKIVAQARPAPGTWDERLRRMAEGVVTVRPVDGAPAAGPVEAVGRIEAALVKGDLREAAQAWQTLPEGARQLSQDWARRLEARIAAEEAAQAVAAQALATVPR